MQAEESPRIPLSRWAGRQLAELAKLAQAPAIARLSGGTILGERAAINGFRIPHHQSAGGGCQLLRASDGWIALNLSRADDRELLPALVMSEGLNALNQTNIAWHVSQIPMHDLVRRGRDLGLAIAAIEGEDVPPAVEQLTPASHSRRAASAPLRRQPLVVDLSSLWAGPLASHLLWLAGAQVIKVESRSRPDAMRQGDPAFFALLNQGKASVSIDFGSSDERASLIGLIERADIVIEASRPRALLQLGIDAEALIARNPALVWLTITGHGASGERANWVGFGDDCGVAGGLSAAMVGTTGVVGLVGDAIADPLTGVMAALTASRARASQRGGRYGLAMSGVVAQALHEESEYDASQLGIELIDWAGANGRPFPPLAPRPVTADLRNLGSNNSDWLGERPLC